MALIIKKDFNLGIRYKFTNIYHDTSNIYSGILHNIQNYPEHRFIFINVQNETTNELSELYSVPVSWVRVYIQAIPQLPGFLNLEISTY